MAAVIAPLEESIAELVHDGDTVALEGFTHLIPFAAGHEIIRQGRRDLTLVRMTPDLVYDQLIGAGCAAQAGLLLGRQPRRRLAAPLPRRGRARLAARRSSSRSTATPGWPTATRPARPGCRSRCCAATAAPTCRAHADRRADRLPVHRRGARPPCRRCGPTSRSSTPSAPTAPATCSCGASPACRRRRCSPPTRSLVTVEEIVDELEPRPGAIVLPAWAIDRVSRRARRRASVVRARLLRRATTTSTGRGTRSAATGTRSRAGSTSTC